MKLFLKLFSNKMNKNQVESDIYVGGYLYNKKQGHGRCKYHNGDTYDGMYDNNQKNGIGTYISMKFGRKYEGEWKDDKLHGIGIMTTKNEKYVGIWEDGKLIKKMEIIY